MAAIDSTSTGVRPPDAAAGANRPWTFTMIAVGQGPPTIVRVRRLLKAALRAYGLRCLRAAEE